MYLKECGGREQRTIMKENEGLWLVAPECRYCGGRGIGKIKDKCAKNISEPSGVTNI
jgi:hypothetical protein